MAPKDKRNAHPMNLPQAHATLLAGVMESDLLVRPHEIEAGRRILARAAKAPYGQGMADWGEAVGNAGNLQDAIRAFKDTPQETRETLLADLWEMAFCDGEVHRDERDFIHSVARLLDLPPLSKGSWPIPATD